MKADFTRDTFNPARHFLRVLFQQGRVQLDADFNEQAAILLHYLQTVAGDIIGPYGGPEGHIGFAVLTDVNQITQLKQAEQNQLKPDETLIKQLLGKLGTDTFDFLLTRGRYYVDGVLSENDDHIIYSTQPNYPRDILKNLAPPYLIYLDVWERSLTYVEDDSIREIALGGPDTAARTRIEWQIRIWPQTEDERKQPPGNLTPDDIRLHWADWVNHLQPANRGRLRASVKNSEGAAATDPCIINPDARYRGNENQLYRVEIHQSGAAGAATFKWSRENGAVIFPILNFAGSKVRLAGLGRDTHLGLQVNDWVEIVDDRITLRNEVNRLYQVAEIEPLDLEVTLKVPDGTPTQTYDETSTLHPYLRRWDQKGDAKAGGALTVTESDKDWITLEDSIQIQFQKDGLYRSGDYWLIPARTATGNIEWPRDVSGSSLALPPRGIEHHYAPLAIWATNSLRPAGDKPDDANRATRPVGSTNTIQDCRLVFTSLAGRYRRR